MMKKHKILFIENEPITQQLIKDYLKSLADVTCVNSASEALSQIEKSNYDMFIIDLFLEDMNGLELIKEIRAKNKHFKTPFVFLTSRKSEDFELEGLAMGAEDYLRKPISKKILVSRINKALGNKKNNNGDILKIGKLQIDLEKMKVNINENGQIEEVELTAKEFKVLVHLVKFEGKVVNRDDLFKIIWGGNSPKASRSIDMHISTLRKKLKSASQYIRTVRARGYSLEILK